MCEFCTNEYHLSNSKWGTGEYGTPGGTVNWSFATTPGTGFGFSSYMTDPIYRGLIRDAFQAWEDVADIDFVEVADGSATEITIGWDTIDGPFGVVGEARTAASKINSTLFSMKEAEIRFDVSESWSDSQETQGSEIGFYQVALHEIGHVIGLNHVDDPGAIMHASNISGIPGLTEGDIEGIQLFYGASANTATPYVATASSDTFIARAGDDVIDGQGGTDTLSLTGTSSEYTLALGADTITLTDRAGRDGTDTLISIERLDFQTSSSASTAQVDLEAFDGAVTLDPGDFAQMVELYIAYFNRAPDAVGLAFWGNALADGLSMQEMAALFIDQTETRDTYPASLSNADFASAVYTNVLGRIPDADGFEFWVGVLEGGNVGRDTFILSVLEGAKADVPAEASQDFITQVLADRQYLSDKTDIGAYFAVHKGMSDIGDAMDVMAIFDGSADSIHDAIKAIDGHYAEALSGTNGDFLLPLVGVLEDPFTG